MKPGPRPLRRPRHDPDAVRVDRRPRRPCGARHWRRLRHWQGARAALRVAGRTLAIVDLDGRAAQVTADEAARCGAPASLALSADVSVAEQVESAFAETERKLGVPAAICAAAAIDIGGSIHHLSSETWRRILAVNLDGVFHTTQHAVRGLLRAGQPGSIVCVSSPAAFVAFASGGAGAYSASKGGVSALVRCLAVEYAPHGIRANAVVPGATETPLMWANARRGPDPRAAPADRRRGAARAPRQPGGARARGAVAAIGRILLRHWSPPGLRWRDAGERLDQLLTTARAAGEAACGAPRRDLSQRSRSV